MNKSCNNRKLSLVSLRYENEHWGTIKLGQLLEK